MSVGIIKFIGGVVITAFLSFLTFTMAMATAISSFPLIGPNLWFAFEYSMFWGVIGGIIVSGTACLLAKQWRTVYWVIGIGGILWSGISGFCFLIYVAEVASC